MFEDEKLKGQLQRVLVSVEQLLPKAIASAPESLSICSPRISISNRLNKSSLGWLLRARLA